MFVPTLYLPVGFFELDLARSSSKNPTGRYNVGTNKKKPRDNSSRFDD